MAGWRPTSRLLVLLLGTALLLLAALLGLLGLGSPFGGSWLWAPAAGERWTETAEASAAAEASANCQATSSEAAITAAQSAVATTAGITVHLTGAVRLPGVYHLQAAATLMDAVTAAGGLTSAAAVEHVNLAALVPDHALIRIPSHEEVTGVTPPLAALSPVMAFTASTDRAGAGPELTSGTSAIDLNTADQQLLETLPGVGPQIALAILRQREELGSFASVEDLLLVPGIGERRLEALRPLVAVAP